MQTSLKNYVYVTPSPNHSQQQRFTSYFSRPTVMLPRPNSRSHVNLKVPTTISNESSTQRLHCNSVRPESTSSGVTSPIEQSKNSSFTIPQATPKVQTDRKIEFRTIQHHSDPIMRIDLSGSGFKKSVVTDRDTTLPSQILDDSRSRLKTTRQQIYSTSYEELLMQENSQLRMENSLLREECEYLREKFTKCLIRKYRPGAQELFD